MYKQFTVLSITLFSTMAMSKSFFDSQYVDLPNEQVGREWHDAIQLPNNERTEAAIQTITNPGHHTIVQFYQGQIYQYTTFDGKCKNETFARILKVNGQRVSHDVHRFTVQGSDYCREVNVPTSVEGNDFIVSEFRSKNFVKWGHHYYSGKGFSAEYNRLMRAI